MDNETLGAALVLAGKRIKGLPDVTPSDAGATVVVGSDGKWTKGEVIPNAVSVSNHKLVIAVE